MEKDNKKLTKEELLKLTGGNTIESILSFKGNGSKDVCTYATCSTGCASMCMSGCVPVVVNAFILDIAISMQENVGNRF